MPQEQLARQTDGETASPPQILKRVLVAEDEHLLARSLAADLAELGYSVIGPAPNGQQAVELARNNKPDLALLDIRMPGMDGLAAAEILFGEMNIPVVFLSAYSDPEYLSAGARLGVFGYLLKPASLDQLRVTLIVSWSKYVRQAALAGQVKEMELKLEQRKLIERAKGLIMKTLNLTEEEAMQKLHKYARNTRRPMADLAKSVIDTQGLILDDRRPG